MVTRKPSEKKETGTERSRWSLRGIAGMAWGGLVGAVSGAVGGLVAPITGFYMKASGQEINRNFTPKRARPLKKVLAGVATFLTSPLTLSAGAVYAVFGAFQGLAHGIYTGHLTFNPMIIGRTTFVVIQRPFLMRAIIPTKYPSVFSLHRAAVSKDANLEWLKTQLQATKSSLSIAKSMDEAKHLLTQETKPGFILIPSDGNPNDFLLSVAEFRQGRITVDTYPFIIQEDGSIKYGDSGARKHGDSDASGLNPGTPSGAPPPATSFTFKALLESLSAQGAQAREKAAQQSDVGRTSRASTFPHPPRPSSASQAVSQASPAVIFGRSGRPPSISQPPSSQSPRSPTANPPKQSSPTPTKTQPSSKTRAVEPPRKGSNAPNKR